MQARHEFAPRFRPSGFLADLLFALSYQPRSLTKRNLPGRLPS